MEARVVWTLPYVSNSGLDPHNDISREQLSFPALHMRKRKVDDVKQFA